MGIPLISLDVPVVKTSSAILCMTKTRSQPAKRQRVSTADVVYPSVRGRIIPARLAVMQKDMIKKRLKKQMEWSAVNVDAAAIAVRQNDR